MDTWPLGQYYIADYMQNIINKEIEGQTSNLLFFCLQEMVIFYLLSLSFELWAMFEYHLYM